MDIQEIWKHWDEDSALDRTKLEINAIGRAKLHNKYIKFLYNENIRLQELKEEYKVLSLEKEEFYTHGPTKETNDRGWKLPAKGVLIVKKEVEKYVAADSDIINMNLEIVAQQEKVDVLKSILSIIQYLNNDIANAIEWIKFTSGN